MLQTNKQMEPSILLVPTDSVGIGKTAADEKLAMIYHNKSGVTKCNDHQQ